jgi:hypothetical protein
MTMPARKRAKGLREALTALFPVISFTSPVRFLEWKPGESIRLALRHRAVS